MSALWFPRGLPAPIRPRLLDKRWEGTACRPGISLESRTKHPRGVPLKNSWALSPGKCLCPGDQGFPSEGTHAFLPRSAECIKFISYQVRDEPGLFFFYWCRNGRKSSVMTKATLKKRKWEAWATIISWSLKKKSHLWELRRAAESCAPLASSSPWAHGNTPQERIPRYPEWCPGRISRRCLLGLNFSIPGAWVPTLAGSRLHVGVDICNGMCQPPFTQLSTFLSSRHSP